MKKKIKNKYTEPSELKNLKQGELVDKLTLIEIEKPIDKVKLTKGDKRKIEIIQAAIKCIAEQGIEATTFESIASVLGIRHSNVTYYFPDKKDIISAAIKYITIQVGKRIDALVSTVKTPRAKLKAYFNSYFMQTREHSHEEAVFLLFFYYCKFNPRYRKLYFKIRSQEIEKVHSILKDIKGFQKLSDKKQQELIGWMIDLVFGARMDLSLIPEFMDYEVRLKRSLKLIFELLDHAVKGSG